MLKKLIEDKKGDTEEIYSAVIFLILNLGFFSLMLFAVVRVGSGAEIIEQANAKKIVLIIDEMKPGTGVKIDISELFEAAEKNNYYGEVVSVNYYSGLVVVRVREGVGWSFPFFTELEAVSVELDNENKLLIINNPS